MNSVTSLVELGTRYEYSRPHCPVVLQSEGRRAPLLFLLYCNKSRLKRLLTTVQYFRGHNRSYSYETFVLSYLNVIRAVMK